MRTRLSGLLLVLPVILVLCVVAYKHGPGAVSNATVTQPKPEPTPASREETLPESSHLYDLFGMRETTVGKGHVSVTPIAHLDALEALYRKRGYQKIEVIDPTKKDRKRRTSSAKGARVIGYFQREEADGAGSITAVGTDADYITDQKSASPFPFSTVVSAAENGEADWIALKFDVDPEKLANLSNIKDGDFPGSDPPTIPRLPGLQRIYVNLSPRGSIAIYKSNESQNSLLLRYLEEMPRRGWRLDSEVTSQANSATHGVMYFTQGQSSCMIWITSDRKAGMTNVTINVH